MYVLARSEARVDKERAMRRRRLKKLLARLHELGKQKLTHDELLMKLGAARTQAGRAFALVQIDIPKRDAGQNRQGLAQRFRFTLNRGPSCAKYAGERGAISCAPISPSKTRARLWEFYIQLHRGRTSL